MIQKLPTNWPFPVSNGQRTEESQKLLDTKYFPREKINLEHYEEALF